MFPQEVHPDDGFLDRGEEELVGEGLPTKEEDTGESSTGGEGKAMRGVE